MLRLPMEGAEMLPATLALARDVQPVEELGQDLTLSVGSRLSTELTVEQASLRGQERDLSALQVQAGGVTVMVTRSRESSHLHHSSSSWWALLGLVCGTSTEKRNISRQPGPCAIVAAIHYFLKYFV